MRIPRVLPVCLVPLAFVSDAVGQERPRMNWARFLERFDTNKDGKLGKDELPERMAGRLMRADANKDGVLTKAELEKMPALRRGGRSRSRGGNEAPGELPIPDIADIPRVGKGERAPRAAMRLTAYILKCDPHVVDGDRYVVLTDHSEADYLASLERLAKHYDGLVIQVANLNTLHTDAKAKARVQDQLRTAKVRYLAVAPRMETYKENTVLGLWELTTTLDDDPQVDVLPGLLLAPTAKHLAALVDRSVKHKPQKPDEFAPFAINQVASNQEVRSLQKSGILRKMFGKMGYATPTVAVYTPKADKAPTLTGDKLWNLRVESRGKFVKEFPPAAAAEFDKASLIVMHGHGIAGMSCSVDTEAIPKDISGKVLLCGSCFSAAPKQTEFPVRQGRGGSNKKEPRPAFALRAVDNGATVVFGHMRLNGGFPFLFPVLECWLEGHTVGEGYQRLINALIAKSGLKPGGFIHKPAPQTRARPQRAGRRGGQRQNSLLYVILGDPALRPFEKMPAKKAR